MIIPRNRLIADLLHRAGFIERVGSGFSRMEKSLLENNNPPLEVVATNFFNIRFYKRLQSVDQSKLSPRQIEIYQMLCNSKGINKRDIASQLNLSDDTTLRELHHLIELGLVTKKGTGKATMYHSNESN